MSGRETFRRFAPAGRWLAQRSPRERVLLAAGALVVGAACVWWGLWLPLLADVARMRNAALDRRAALTAAMHMAEAIPALARTSRATPTIPARAAVEQAVASKIKAVPAIEIDAQEDRVRAALPAVPFDALVGMIESLQRDAALQLLEARLTARVDPGTVRAELVFGR